jgi:hypothetical protein
MIEILNPLTPCLPAGRHPSPLRGEGKSCLPVGRGIYLACLSVVPPCGTKAGIWNLIIGIYFF